MHRRTVDGILRMITETNAFYSHWTGAGDLAGFMCAQSSQEIAIQSLVLSYLEVA